jgi:hypothetical protein
MAPRNINKHLSPNPSTTNFSLPNVDTESATGSRSSDGGFVSNSARYKDVNWELLPGYQMSSYSKKKRETILDLEYGYEILHTATGAKYWLCIACQKEETFKKYATMSTQNAAKHLEDAHQITEEGQPRRIEVFETIRSETSKD